MPVLKGSHLVGTNTLFQARRKRCVLTIAVRQLLPNSHHSRRHTGTNKTAFSELGSDRLALTGSDRCDLKSHRDQERRYDQERHQLAS